MESLSLACARLSAHEDAREAATQLSEQLAQLRMALADTHDVVVARTAELKVRQV